jgi:hypothetical protein
MNDGAGYSVAIYNNDLYFGLSNGIYQLPLSDVKDLSYIKDDFKFIVGGQTWGLSVVNNNLLAGKDEGFFLVKNNTAIPVIKTTGYWTFQPLQNIQQESVTVAGNYHGVHLFESKDNGFIDIGPVGSLNEPSRYLVIDNNNTIWVSHPYRGVYKIELPQQLSEAKNAAVKLYTAANGLPSSLNNQVYKIKNKVVIATEKRNI